MKYLLTPIMVLSFVCLNSYSLKSTNKVRKVQVSGKITFIENDNKKSVDVMVDGKLFTTYRWPDNICKPILYPVCTATGTEITRGFPLKPRDGERNDHFHHVGMWFSYGNVDGYDFWSNGSEGLGTQNPNGGIIKHQAIEEESGGIGEGLLATISTWIDAKGNILLKEHSEYHFIAQDAIRIIDRITTLTALNKDVSMHDTKEGMFGMRVDRQLELPSTKEVTLYSADGHPTKVSAMSNEGITGNYLSSEGISGIEVWGTRAKWMSLYGNIDDEKVSISVCDHPKNQSYPTYWHARGYGLFSVNPLGGKDFTKGKEEVKFEIPSGESATFRYRVIISSGSHLTKAEIDAYAEEFAQKY